MTNKLLYYSCCDWFVVLYLSEHIDRHSELLVHKSHGKRGTVICARIGSRQFRISGRGPRPSLFQSKLSVVSHMTIIKPRKCVSFDFN